MLDSIVNIPSQVDFNVSFILLMIFMIIMIITCIWLAISNNLFESAILMSIFSLSIGICYLFMDAPDVAMTESALGSCLSTAVFINLIKIVGEKVPKVRIVHLLPAIILCLLLFCILAWTSTDLPEFGNINAAIHNGASKYYLENTKNDIDIPSIVAAILASYRGFDTLGETTVILLAGISCLFILPKKK